MDTTPELVRRYSWFAVSWPAAGCEIKEVEGAAERILVVVSDCPTNNTAPAETTPPTSADTKKRRTEDTP
jgi:hypothetical protein